MSFATGPAYLAWANRSFGTRPFDLMTSGASPCPLEALPPIEGALDDPRAGTLLAEEIAVYCRVDAADVVPCLGTSHALFLAFAALAERGDEVLLETPVYEPLVTVSDGLGLPVRFFERDHARRYAIDAARVLSAVGPKTRVVAISNPHNPSGVREGDEPIRALAVALAERGVALLVDEVYSPFDRGVALDGTLPCVTARTFAPNVVVVSSLTKCFGVGAHRAGFVLAEPAIAERARNVLASTLGHLPAVHATVSLHAFRHRQFLATRALAGIAERRATVHRFMESRSDLTWSEPADGFFGFARSSSPAATDDYSTKVDEAASREGVLVVPGHFFRDPRGFRLAWAGPPAIVEEGLTRLARALDAVG